jgi:hypothetical protein
MDFTTNRQAIINALRGGQLRAICGYPGIGKTTLTYIDDRFEDGFLSDCLYLDKQNGIKNPAFPANYIMYCQRALKQGKIVVTAMSDEARVVFDMLGMKYLVIYPDIREKGRYFEIYDTRLDVREWIEYNKQVWNDKINKLDRLVVPAGCFKDKIPYGMNLAEYLYQMGIIEENKLHNNVKIRELL